MSITGETTDILVPFTVDIIACTDCTQRFAIFPLFRIEGDEYQTLPQADCYYCPYCGAKQSPQPDEV